MRTGLVVVAGLVCLIVGGTCLPLVDNTVRTPAQGTVLSMALTVQGIDANTPDISVSAGHLGQISWEAGNLTGESATVTVLVESRTDLTRTTLVSDITIAGTGGSGEVTWNTTGFSSGPYAVYGQIQTASRFVEKRATGLIGVTPAVVSAFTAPAADAALACRQTPLQSVTISWVARGRQGGAAAGAGSAPADAVAAAPRCLAIKHPTKP